MLIRTTQHLKEVLPISSNFDANEVLPFVEEIENTYIKQLISTQQYADLDAAITSSTITTAQANLIKYCRRAIAPLAFYKWLPYGSARITSRGITINLSENERAAAEWQIEKIEQNAYNSGMAALEELLKFLEANIATYTIYATYAHSANAKAFIASATEFNNYYHIPVTRYTFIRLLPLINQYSDFIKNVIGQNLYDTLLNSISAGTVTDANAKILPYIRRYVTNMSIAKAFETLPLQVDNLGITINDVTNQIRNRKQVQGNQLSNVAAAAQREAESQLNSLQIFLNDNISDYPLYAAATEYDSTATGEFENEADKGYFFI